MGNPRNPNVPTEVDEETKQNYAKVIKEFEGKGNEEKKMEMHEPTVSQQLEVEEKSQITQEKIKSEEEQKKEKQYSDFVDQLIFDDNEKKRIKEIFYHPQYENQGMIEIDDYLYRQTLKRTVKDLISLRDHLMQKNETEKAGEVSKEISRIESRLNNTDKKIDAKQFDKIFNSDNTGDETFWKTNNVGYGNDAIIDNVQNKAAESVHSAVTIFDPSSRLMTDARHFLKEIRNKAENKGESVRTGNDVSMRAAMQKRRALDAGDEVNDLKRSLRNYKEKLSTEMVEKNSPDREIPYYQTIMRISSREEGVREKEMKWQYQVYTAAKHPGLLAAKYEIIEKLYEQLNRTDISPSQCLEECNRLLKSSATGLSGPPQLESLSNAEILSKNRGMTGLKFFTVGNDIVKEFRIASQKAGIVEERQSPSLKSN